MVNVPYLDSLLDSHKISKTRLARKMRISRMALYNKLNGKVEFTASQADILCGELNITTDDERKKIFTF